MQGRGPGKCEAGDQVCRLTSIEEAEETEGHWVRRSAGPGAILKNGLDGKSRGENLRVFKHRRSRKIPSEKARSEGGGWGQSRNQFGLKPSLRGRFG